MLYEHVGDNRSGKTFTNALFAWEAYNLGRKIYCNCSLDIEREGEYLCILNFPHYHIDLDRIRKTNLTNCYVMSDESVEFLDARRAMKQTILELTYFNRQATKRNVDWHYDAVRHEDIDPRVRTNPHFRITTVRVPKDPRKPLLAIRVRVENRYSSTIKRFSLSNYSNPPLSSYYPIYNDITPVYSSEN